MVVEEFLKKEIEAEDGEVVLNEDKQEIKIFKIMKDVDGKEINVVYRTFMTSLSELQKERVRIVNKYEKQLAEIDAQILQIK